MNKIKNMTPVIEKCGSDAKESRNFKCVCAVRVVVTKSLGKGRSNK